MPTLTISSDKPVVVLPVEEYEELLERLEILSNPSLLRDVKRGLREFEEGKTPRLSDIRKRERAANGSRTLFQSAEAAEKFIESPAPLQAD